MNHPQKPMLLDVHAHLCDEVFDDDRGKVLERAKAAGVGGVVAVGETLEDARKNLKSAEEYPGVVWPSAGLYPTLLDPDQAEAIIDFIRENRSYIIAIGEVGLDHWKVKEKRDQELQEKLFGRFVQLSIELELPLNVHSRSAGRKAIELLQDHGARSVLMHAFDGKAASAMAGVEAGYFFSIPPSVVRSPQKQKLVRRLPLENILLETDSPVLGPDPNERNEPTNLRLALEAVAELKGLSEQEVLVAVVENQRRLFGI
jgi:TatD DNase family protein